MCCQVYFNIEDISKCPGFNLDLSGVTERYHLNLLNMILEFPNTELVTDLFRLEIPFLRSKVLIYS
jgi:hypothetical protein